MPKNVRRLPEIAVVPPTIAGVGQVYVKAADSLPYFKDSAGVEHSILGTKEFFNPIFGGTDVDWKGAIIDTAGDFGVVSLLVPQDFSSLTSIELIFLPLATGASMNFVVVTRYGAYNGGESASGHTETADPRDIGATVNGQNVAHSISDLVDIAALAAGDLLSVEVYYDVAAIASNGVLRGIRFKYA